MYLERTQQEEANEAQKRRITAITSTYMAVPMPHGWQSLK